MSGFNPNVNRNCGRRMSFVSLLIEILPGMMRFGSRRSMAIFEL